MTVPTSSHTSKARLPLGHCARPLRRLVLWCSHSPLQGALPPGQPLISLHCAPPRPSPSPLLFLTPQDHNPTRLPPISAPGFSPNPSNPFSSGPGPPPNSHHRWASPSSPSTTISRLALLGPPPGFPLPLQLLERPSLNFPSQGLTLFSSTTFSRTRLQPTGCLYRTAFMAHLK